MKSVFVSVVGIPPMPSVSVVFVPVTPLCLRPASYLCYCSCPLDDVMVRVASIASVLSGRCSAAVAASDRGVASLAPSCGGKSVSGLTGAPLQAGRAQGVEEEALVGAPQGTFQPGREVNRLL